MKKTLLLGAVALGVSLTGSALEVGEYVYTPQGRFQITGADNLCTNGSFANGSFDGWNVLSATEGVTVGEQFAYDPDAQSIKSQKNACTEGMYYKFSAPANATAYVVSFKIRQQTLAYPYSTNAASADNAEVGKVYGAAANMASTAGLNDVNLIGNASNSGYNGAEDFVQLGKGVTLTTEWKTVAFAVKAGESLRDYYLTFAGMNTGVEIADVEIHEAVETADPRKAENVLTLANTLVNAYGDVEGCDVSGIQENLDNYDENSSPEDFNSVLADISNVCNEFLNGTDEKQVDNFLSSCASKTDWTTLGNNDKAYRKLTSLGDWTLPSGRWFHWNGFNCEAALHSPSFGHTNGARGEQVMSMTKELAPGTYIFTLDAAQRSCYNGNGGYIAVDGLETGSLKLAIEKVTGEGDNAVNEEVASNTISPLPTPELVAGENDSYKTNAVTYKVTEAGNYTFKATFEDALPEGMTAGRGGVAGGSFIAQTPRIYVKLAGKYDAAQLSYEKNVRAQIEAGRSNLDKAKAYIADANKYWYKKELQDTIDLVEPLIAEYEKKTQDEIISTYDPETYVAGPTNENGLMEHEVYDTAVKFIIAANKTFAQKATFIDNLDKAIASANKTLALRIYDYATGKTALEKGIADANALREKMAAADHSEENEAAITENISSLNTLVSDLDASIPADKISSLADIDFSNDAVYNADEDKYTIPGAAGSMVFDAGTFVTETPVAASNGTGVMNFEKGIDKNGEKILADVLRVGQGSATVEFDASDIASDILRVSCDFWFLRLSDSYTGFYLQNLDADGNSVNVSGFRAKLYDNATDYNPCNLTFKNSGLTPANTAGDDASYTDAQRTHFEFVLDYGSGKMYAKTASENGTQMTELVDFDRTTPVSKFVLSSNTKLASGKSYIGRRSWFDNLKIEKITANPATGINEVKNAENAAADDAIYNIAGQKVTAPVKGQIYIKKGAAFVK